MGYTFKKDVEEQKNNLVKALNESLQPDGNSSSTNIDSSESTPPHKMHDISSNSNYYGSQMGSSTHNESKIGI